MHEWRRGKRKVEKKMDGLFNGKSARDKANGERGAGRKRMGRTDQTNDCMEKLN